MCFLPEFTNKPSEEINNVPKSCPYVLVRQTQVHIISQNITLWNILYKMLPTYPPFPNNFIPTSQEFCDFVDRTNANSGVTSADRASASLVRCFRERDHGNPPRAPESSVLADCFTLSCFSMSFRSYCHRTHIPHQYLPCVSPTPAP